MRTHSAALPREAELVLRSAGGAEQDAALRRLVGGNLDWRRVRSLAIREQAVAVLWRRLGQLGPVPDGAEMALGRRAMLSEIKLLELRRRLYESIDALSAAGIEVMLLKGAGVAHTAYPTFSLRPMADIDLLVRAADAAQAAAVLAASGWSARDGSHAGDGYGGHQHLPPFDDERGSGIGLDLHTEFFALGHPFRMSVDRVWREGVVGAVPNRAAFVPSPAWQLLHACLHFAWSHGMTAAAWRTFRDAAAITAGGGVDWEEFVALARDTRGASCCYWTLRMARAASGIGVPDDLLAALRPAGPTGVLARAERHFLAGLLPTAVACPSTRVSQIVWEIGVRPRDSGHGNARPWDRDHLFVPAPALGSDADHGDAPPALRRGRPARWSSYLRAVL